jgi:hypothetical protein
MSYSLPGSLLSISIDAELDTTRRGFDQQAQLEVVTGKLLALLSKYQLPATWGVADPAMSAATDRIMGAATGHEVAVLGDQSWVGRTAGRNRFGNELQRRVTHGRAAGLEISSLILRDAQLDDHTDLVVKSGITSILEPDARPRRWLSTSRAIQSPQQIHFGLWKLSVSCKLPGDNRWLPSGGGTVGANRVIKIAVAQKLPVQLLLNCLDLAMHRTALSGLEGIFRQIALRREQAVLQVSTQTALAVEITGRRSYAPSHSILRPAA